MSGDEPAEPTGRPARAAARAACPRRSRCRRSCPPATAPRDLERIRAAAPGARIVTLSRRGPRRRPGRRRRGAAARLARRPMRSTACSPGRPRLAWVHSATAGVERALTPAARRARHRDHERPRRLLAPDRRVRVMMILAVSRQLPRLLELQRERTWQPLEGARAARRDGRDRRARLDRAGGRGARDRVRLPGGRDAGDDAATARPAPAGSDEASARSAKRCSIASAGPRRCRSSSRSRTSSSSRRRSPPRPRT